MARLAHRRPVFDANTFGHALLAGEFELCRSLVAAGDSPEAVLASARLALRERRYVEAIGSLTKFRGTATQDVEREVLLGAARGLTKDYAAGEDLLNHALGRANGEALRADALYFLALLAWMQHDCSRADAFVERLMKSRDRNQRARGHIVRSWIAVRRRDLRSQVRELEAALRELDDAPVPDEYYRASALHTLSLLCRELPLPKLAKRIRTLHRSIHWADGLRLQHFLVTRFLAGIDELDGNELAAFRGFKEAGTLAPSQCWRVFSLLDRARLARDTGELAFAADQLYEAHALASELSWADSVDEERLALLVFAELFADVDAKIAHRYLARFRDLSRPVAPTLGYTGDPRVRAFEAYSAGLAYYRLGETDRAEKLLLEAWEIFEEFSYAWRAALCAVSLAQLTQLPVWIRRAKQRIAPWPRSWIARRIAAATATSKDDAPPPAQAQVLELLLSGRKNADIAEKLGRSPHTIRNQIAELFKFYDVRTRAELVATVLNARQVG